ncbi:H-NS family nucleoid-associated regulatory protein [Rhizobacter fulvus]
MEVRKQIAQLKAVEDKLRQSEAQGVIARIREAIAVYGLTKSDLFGDPLTKAGSRPKSKRATGVSAQYSDGSGNTWSGRGRRPGWIAQALSEGKSLSDFSAGKAPDANEEPSAKLGTMVRKLKTAKAPKKVAIKYQSAGQTWSGRGSQPKWLKAALAEGKALSDFAV